MTEDTFILLPRKGFFGRPGEAAHALLMSLPLARSTRPSVDAILPLGIAAQIVDTTAENGPKLLKMPPEAARDLNASDAPVRALPLVVYGLPDPFGLVQSAVAGIFEGGPPASAASPKAGASARPAIPEAGMAAAYPIPGPGGIPLATVPPLGASFMLNVRVTDARSGATLPGVVVAGISGAQVSRATTDSNGVASLGFPAPTMARLYCMPDVSAGYWGAYRSNVAANGSLSIALAPVDLTGIDAVRHYYGSSRFDAAMGVTVGVIDTGVGPHRDLNLVGGRNTVTGELAADYHDGYFHGTHVAGLVGAVGGLRGLAPHVPIRAYRVFGQGGAGASNYAILKAMIFAANDQCDIINLSLGGGPYDAVVEEAITDARNQGMLVVIAAGNDGRQVVSYPAAYQGATAVSALGNEGTFPSGSTSDGDVQRPPYSTSDPQEFLAAFSNVGPQIAVTAPGVGVLSTLPNDRYGPLSGTSMAAPVVAGAAACLLSRDPVVFAMLRNAGRSSAIERLLQTNCVRRGMGLIYEGYGLPDPAKV